MLAYWFDGADDSTVIDSAHPAHRRWFAGQPAVDAEVQRAFAADMEAARAGACAAWTTPTETLAHVLLLDQVPRHVHRGAARAFDSDRAALELTRSCIDRGADERLRLIERSFLYLPLQHSERLEDHDLALELHESLIRRARGAGLGIASFLEAELDAELEHIDLLRRFGRYPGRNAALGRESTPAELAYLGSLDR